ncbi:MAG: dipeptide ABC transporter ATP-binding protein [Anaerolineae bacterium]|nr:dipeptide ABC transporter ATP-binding protein [Anaerolineae bacterium]
MDKQQRDIGAQDSPVLVSVEDLKKYFPIQRGLFRRTVGYVKAVDGVSFFINEGETLGLVGESGCGKTTTGRLILRAMEPTEGHIFYRQHDRMIDLAGVPSGQMKSLRREMQIIFQDPFSSLNPRMTVMDIISEPLEIHNVAQGQQLKDHVCELLEAVGLKAQHMNRYPYAFSGGQRQRIGIARALALRPRLIIADEPVSALDVSVQAQVLNLLEDLKHKFGLTYLFIAHDLSVVEHISDRVAVMYLGTVVELASSDDLYMNPGHPYTEALLSAVPRSDPDQPSNRILLSGDIPSPANPPPGCKFHPRCPYAQDICSHQAPEWYEISPKHWVVCHFAGQLDLSGIAFQ